MGHIRFGRLPKTHKWKQVIGLLKEGTDLSELATASLDASLTGLKRIPSDTGFLEVLNSIFELAAASREKDIQSALLRIGIDSNDQKASFGFLSAISEKINEDLGKVYPRSDAGKIALDSFLSSLSKQIMGKTGELFLEKQNAQSLTESFRGNQFKVLMHEFYSAFTSKYLNYYLSRELPNHIGEGKQFSNIDEHSEFSRQFDLHCRQTVRIADEFTPGWIGKAVYQDDYSPDAVSRYAHVAFKKIISEFKRSAR